jgi:hypothetical protein
MKNIIKYIFLFFLGCSGKLISQDSLHIYDLQAVVIFPSPSSNVGVANVSPTSFTVTIYFSVDKPDSTTNFNILVGNNADDGMLDNQQIKMVKHPGWFCMHDSISNREIHRFYNKTTKYELILNQAGLKQLKYVTVNGRHKNGSYSQKKYFKIQ